MATSTYNAENLQWRVAAKRFERRMVCPYPLCVTQLGKQLGNFEFSNGTLAIGPLRQKLQGEIVVQLSEHQWEVLGVPIYMYLTGSILEGELAAALHHCEAEVTRWALSV